MNQYHGLCMCGEVKFSFSGTPRFIKDCVCDSCRRAHGASAVCWVGVATSQFEFDSGEVSLSWYRSSAASERGFCTTCGTRILFRSSKWPGEIHMALACMTIPHDLVATDVVFKDELPAWTAMSLGEKRL
ncbi:MAG: GFA family protein [Gammaproteobacteria bacterium]|nr:GFA family protein [Gammaproteobacteria bacterium]